MGFVDKIIQQQESPPTGYRKRRTTHGTTCPSIYYPGVPTLDAGTYIRWGGYLPWDIPS